MKTGKTNKILYKYRPTEEFEEKLQKLFLTVNLDTYKSLRRPSLNDLYFKLLIRIYNENNKGHNQIKYNILELAELVNISTENIDKYFSKIKNKVNKKIQDILIPEMQKNIPSFNFKWTIEGKYKVPNVGTFTWVTDNIFTGTTDKDIYNDIFYTRLYKDLFSNFKENYLALETDIDKIYTKFLQWLLLPDDFNIKTSIFITAYSFIKGNTPNVDKYSLDYFLKLIDIGKSHEKHQFISIKDHQFHVKTLDTNDLVFHHIKDLIMFLMQNISKVKEIYPS